MYGALKTRNENREDRMNAAKTLDCKGMACPMPIVKLSKSIKELESGQVLEVLADDPGFEPDVKAWCESTGHHLKSVSNNGDDVIVAYIEKT
jgi:tRNA 2-thiouridine synthesizing protein A